MRAQTVNENIEFKRGRSTTTALGVGHIVHLREQLPELKELTNRFASHALLDFHDITLLENGISGKITISNPCYSFAFGYEADYGLPIDSNESVYGDVWIDPIDLKVYGEIEYEKFSSSVVKRKTIPIPNAEIKTMASYAVDMQADLIRQAGVELSS